jgi:pimeloyl-ACP methyl ester carboxylesterase
MPPPAASPARTRRALLALGAASLAAGGCTLLDERLRAAVFRPSRQVPASFAGLRAGDERLRLPVPATDGAAQWIDLWWLPAGDPDAPALLYLHGTFRNLYHNHPKMEAIRASGFSVLGVEYRGWGDSSPLLPSERSLVADAELGWLELVRRQPRASRRVIFGHSLGSAVAVELAARLADAPRYGGLILESAFSSGAALARATSPALGTPLAWLVTLGFDSRSRIGATRGPLLMLHGTADDTVPIALARRLHEAAPEPRRLVEFPGGSHSRLHEDDPALYRTELAGFAAARAAAGGASASV